jgi:hypothetical protein
MSRADYLILYFPAIILLGMNLLVLYIVLRKGRR